MKENKHSNRIYHSAFLGSPLPLLRIFATVALQSSAVALIGDAKKLTSDFSLLLIIQSDKTQRVSISRFVLEEPDSVWFHHDIIFVWNQILLCPFHQVPVLENSKQMSFSCGSNIYHLLFPFIVYSWCIVVFIDNVRTTNDEQAYVNSVHYIVISQQRG